MLEGGLTGDATASGRVGHQPGHRDGGAAFGTFAETGRIEPLFGGLQFLPLPDIQIQPCRRQITQGNGQGLVAAVAGTASEDGGKLMLLALGQPGTDMLS